MLVSVLFFIFVLDLLLVWSGLSIGLILFFVMFLSSLSGLSLVILLFILFIEHNKSSQ